MSIKKFKFVSPGVQMKELDQSQLPKLPDPIGPVVFGRSRKGPALIPTTVNSYLEFVEMFGYPVRGAGTGDIWRDGNTTSPTYGAYAAEAYLRNAQPLTFVRLLGTDSDNATSADTATAGWTTENTSAGATNAVNGGAVGLWVIPSASAGYASEITGALAAVFYLDKGSMRLVGTDSANTDVGALGAATLVESIGSSYEFRLVVEDENGASAKDTAFNFNPNSAKYIRKVFNTNPTLTNDEVTPAASLKNYFLGETFESHLKTVVSETSGNVAGNVYGFVAALENSTINHADFKGVEASAAKSGWVIGQDLNTITGSFQAAEMPELFRFVVNKGDGSGEYEQNNVKISVTDIQPSNSSFDRYGTFTVEVRKIDDTDTAKEVIEVYPQLSLNPNSLNYIAKKIGDMNVAWDKTERRHREYGDFPNVSNIVRVEVNPIVEQGGLEPELLPFGFFGPTRFKPIDLVSGSAVAATALMVGSGSMPDSTLAGGGTIAIPGITAFSASLEFPTMQLRFSSSDAGTLSPADAYFGVINQKVGAQKFDEDVRDLVRVKPDGVDSHIAGTATEYQFVFSLDDVISTSGSTNQSYWLSGSRASGRSTTAVAAAASGSGEGYKAIINRGHDKFTLPIFGGFDGLDITERDPFRNAFLTKGGADQDANYAVYSLKQAIDSVRDPEVLDINLAAIPGITVPGVTNHLVDTVEARADALAIIDIEGGYTPSHESNNAESARLGSVSATITALKARSFNTSYACTYYPWVRVNDSQSGFPVWMPPSVVALGTMASSQKKSQVWMAPAGFNRGGLTNGSSGLQVTNVREKLTQTQRDKLYEVNINPIASFPSEGIVIFGQKTLKSTASALDRINVRRLLIHLKKEISKISNGILFDQNLKVTWARFLTQVKPFLESVQTNFGLSDFRVILDESTTTADLIDRNIMYAKIFLKPARAIEFIALDFVVARTGASFEDL